MTATAVYDGYGNTVATSGSTSSPYHFGARSGYRNDGDAGIMQLGARYYDTATGSFLTRDTDLSQLAYVCCGDVPIDRLDPSGHRPADNSDLAALLGAIGGVIASPPISKSFIIGSFIAYEKYNHPEWFKWLLEHKSGPIAPPIWTVWYGQ